MSNPHQIRAAPPPAAVGVLDYFVVYRAEPETVYTVGPLSGGQPPLTISIAALGGGTVGQSYADNQWIYAVHLGGALVASGIDLRSGGAARTHRQMAAALAATLADGDSSPPVLAAHAARLSQWAGEVEHGTGPDTDD